MIHLSLTEEEKEHVDKINKLTHEEIARLWRFAPAGHPYFDFNLPYHSILDRRFRELGGMTPEISKKIGW